MTPQLDFALESVGSAVADMDESVAAGRPLAGVSLGRNTGSGVYRERVSTRACAHVHSLACVIADISMGGCLVAWAPDGALPSEGAELSLQVTLEDETYFDGHASVVRVDDARRLVALSVVSGFIDVPRLQDHEDRVALTRAFDAYAEERALIPEAFQLVLSQMVDFHCYFRDLLRPREAGLREQGARAEEALQALTRQTYERMAPRWRELRDAAAAACWPYVGNPVVFAAMKRMTVRVLTSDLLGAPLVERAFRKPLGYAGDYRTMTYLYEHGFEGPCVVDRVFHRLFADEALAEGVRRRKDLMKALTAGEHRRRVEESGPEAVTRVLSLGCGPALEVLELVRESSWSGSIHWTLVDQESRALSIAYGDNFRAIRGGAAPKATIRCLNLSLRRLLKERLMPPERQDFIYAAGLFDYLEDRVAKNLIETFAQSLAPGGLIAIGNARRDPANYWTTEFVCDWPLLYRTQEEMVGLTTHLGPGFSSEIIVEPAKAYWFALIRRTAE